MLPDVQHLPTPSVCASNACPPMTPALVGTDLHRLRARPFQANLMTHDALLGWLTAFVT